MRHGGTTTPTRRAATIAAGVVLAAAAVGLPPSGADAIEECGTEPPPEATANAAGWPLPNADLENTRAIEDSPIEASSIDALEQVWTYDVPGSALFGNLTTNPVVTDGTVYVGALDGSTHAVDLADGAERWSVRRDVNVFGPAGVAMGWGKVFGIDGTATVAAHDADDGSIVWRRNLLVAPGNQVDMAPTLVGGCVLVSTQALAPGSRGTLYALDQADGSIVWQFETVPDDFWGNPRVNHGGGAWYPPAVDPDTGHIYWGTSNPWPAPGAPGFPAGASRPGDNLYTNSALATDGAGDLRWFHQVFPHDIWDRDMVLTQFVELPDGDEVVVHTGKGGRVLGYDPDTGEVLWDTPVGRHQNDDLLTFTEPTTVMPGVLGGVETPPATADGIVYLAVVNAPSTYDSPEDRFNLNAQLGTYPSNLVAVDARTGAILWQIDVPGDALGGVTVVNDLLLTSTFGGLLLAYDRATGAEVWRHDAGVMVNGWPAVVGDTIVWPVSGGAVSQLVTFRLPRDAWPTTTTTSPASSSSTTTSPTTTSPTTTGTSTPPRATAAAAVTATPTYTS